MTTLTDADIASMQAAIEELMPDTCVIQSLALTADGQGGATETWSAAGTVACRMDNTGGRARVGGAASIEDFTNFVLTVPQATTITTLNRVVHSGETYNVLSVSDTGSWLACKRAALGRI